MQETPVRISLFPTITPKRFLYKPLFFKPEEGRKSPEIDVGSHHDVAGFKTSLHQAWRKKAPAPTAFHVKRWVWYLLFIVFILWFIFS